MKKGESLKIQCNNKINMTISEFIVQFNKSKPDIEVILKKYKSLGFNYSNTDEASYLMNNILTWKSEVTNETVSIKNLFEKTNLNDICIGAITFRYQVLNPSNPIYCFAKVSEFYNLCQNEETKWIYFTTTSNSESELLTKNEIDFFNFLILYNQIDINLIFNTNSNIDFKLELKKLISNGFNPEFIDYLIQL